MKIKLFDCSIKSNLPNMEENTDFIAFNKSKTIGIEDRAINNEAIQGLSVSTLPPWMQTENIKESSPFIKLHNEIICLSEYLSPGDNERQVRQGVVQDLANIVAIIWPQATVHVFGSQMTNLLIPHSDIDVTVLNVPLKTENNSEIVMCLELLAESIKKSPSNLASYLEVISSAKFPIVKFTHRDADISVDVCINNKSGLDTGKIMKRYLRMYPMLRPLSLTIKLYLAQRKLHETYSGGIGSYVLLNMVISFLQMRQRLASYLNQETNWNLGALLLDFFRYYSSNFNFITTGMSISNGILFNKRERGGDFYAINKPVTLSIENPDPAIQPPVDIGKNSFMIAKIRRSFEYGAQVLTCILASKNNSPVTYLAYLIRADDELLSRRNTRYALTKPIIEVDSSLQYLSTVSSTVQSATSVYKALSANESSGLIDISSDTESLHSANVFSRNKDSKTQLNGKSYLAQKISGGKRFKRGRDVELLDVSETDNDNKRRDYQPKRKKANFNK